MQSNQSVVKNPVVIVTGSSIDIGAACVLDLAKRGFHLGMASMKAR